MHASSINSGALALAGAWAPKRPTDKSLMRLKSTKTLYAYWNELRGTRLAPHRFEIEPSRIADILPETFILEKVARSGFRYRLAGTRVCDRLGSEFRGADFLKSWNKDDRLTMERDLTTVVNHGAVLVVDVKAQYSHGESIEFEFLVLPLFHTGDTIERLMGVVSTSTNTDYQADPTLKSLNLVKTHLRWPARAQVQPDARTQIQPDARTSIQPDECALPPQNTRQSVFEPHVRKARVVRHAHRTFRVYEGGLSQHPKTEK